MQLLLRAVCRYFHFHLRVQILSIDRLPTVEVVCENSRYETKLLDRAPRIRKADVPKWLAEDGVLEDAIAQPFTSGTAAANDDLGFPVLQPTFQTRAKIWA